MVVGVCAVGLVSFPAVGIGQKPSPFSVSRAFPSVFIAYSWIVVLKVSLWAPHRCLTCSPSSEQVLTLPSSMASSSSPLHLNGLLSLAACNGAPLHSFSRIKCELWFLSSFPRLARPRPVGDGVVLVLAPPPQCPQLSAPLQGLHARRPLPRPPRPPEARHASGDRPASPTSNTRPALSLKDAQQLEVRFALMVPPLPIPPPPPHPACPARALCPAARAPSGSSA